MSMPPRVGFDRTGGVAEEVAVNPKGRPERSERA
jgi:hypothetical protein